jgi:hypothetical protein
VEISSTKRACAQAFFGAPWSGYGGLERKFAFLVVSACRVKVFPPTRCHRNEVFLKYAYVGPAHSKKKSSPCVRAWVWMSLPKAPKNCHGGSVIGVLYSHT